MRKRRGRMKKMLLIRKNLGRFEKQVEDVVFTDN